MALPGFCRNLVLQPPSPKPRVTSLTSAASLAGGLIAVFAAQGAFQEAFGQNAAETELPEIEVTAPAASAPAAKSARKQQAQGSSSAVPAATATEPGPSPQGPGVTETTAGPVDGYRALTATSATKTERPIDKIPQSIQVIPKSVIDDQAPISIDEISRNVSGVLGTLRLQTPAYDSGKIRGFFSEQRLDGLPVTYNPGFRDSIVNIERIEVLKGPTAVLYGGGLGAPVGGALNVVSKMPFDAPRAEFGATIGTDSYYRPYFDINQPIAADGTVLFRLTGEYLDAGSFIDHIETQAFALNPTLMLRPSDATTLTIQGHVSRWEQPEYQGLPAVGTVAGDFRVDRSLFSGAREAPDAHSARDSVTVTLDHAFSSDIDSTLKARWTRSDLAEVGQILVGSDGLMANIPMFPPSRWLATNGFLDQNQDEFLIAGDTRFRSSGSWHKSTLLVGADYSRLAADGAIVLDVFRGGAGIIDLKNPAPLPFVRPPKALDTAVMDEREVVVSQGAYVQLESTLADRLHIVAGVRLADIDIDFTDFIDGTRANERETRLLPRIGALLDVTDRVSVFAGYSEGLTSYALVGLRGLPPPEMSSQVEGGLKFDLGGGLTGTAALFQLDRYDTPVGFDAVMIGTSHQRARGAELDVIWQPTPNWKILGSYAFIDTEVVSATALIQPGARRIGVPEHSGRLWIDYAFDAPALQGWSVGAGLYAASGQVVDPLNLFFTDSYMTVDAKISYATDDWKITASAKNLLDEDYFVSHFYLGGRVAPGDARAFYLTLARTY